MAFKGNIFLIKDGKLQQWRAWCARLQSELSAEAKETLREERCEQEAFLIFQIDGKWYTAGVGEGEGECLPATERPINLEHKRMKKECLEKTGPVENGYHLKV